MPNVSLITFQLTLSDIAGLSSVILIYGVSPANTLKYKVYSLHIHLVALNLESNKQHLCYLAFSKYCGHVIIQVQL